MLPVRALDAATRHVAWALRSEKHLTSSTRMRSASFTVLSRCATMMVVRCSLVLAIAVCIRTAGQTQLLRHGQQCDVASNSYKGLIKVNTSPSLW